MFSCVLVIIYFSMVLERKTTGLSIYTGMLFNQSDVRNICRDCCGQSERQPPLILRAAAIRTGFCQMVSYLIVRLEMQYFHITFHTAVTSLEASDMPEKNAHGTKKEVLKKKKKVSKHKTAATPP